MILELEGVPIAADETIQFRDDERVDYNHVISLKHVDETLQLKILRQGQVGGRGFCCKQHVAARMVLLTFCLPA